MLINAGRISAGARRRPVAPPPQLVLGLALLAVVWPLAWAGPTPFSSYTFFPLWLGYILAVDGLVLVRTGTSLMVRAGWRFALLFAVSAPLWWLYEGFNQRLHNWRYVLPESYGPVVYVLLASLAFSTVVPALFVTAEFYRSLPPFRRAWLGPRVAPGTRGLWGVVAAGVVMVALTLAFPRQAFPLVWLGLFFVLDPINRLTGARSLAGQVAKRRWDTVVVLGLAALTCGFFWEMWNYWSSPKWVYQIPYAGWARVFEMPLLGYGGYVPFGLEVYALYQAAHRLVLRRPDALLTFDRVPDREELSESPVGWRSPGPGLKSRAQ